MKNDRADQSLTDLENLSYPPLGFTRPVCCANQLNLRKSQFGVLVFRAKVSLSNYLSSASHHIRSVFFRSSELQVVWTNARRIVAIVKYPHSFWYSTEVNYPRSNVSKNRRVRLFPSSNLTIAPTVPRSCPLPTAIPNSDFRPKAFQECWRKTLRSKKLSAVIRPLDQVHFDWVTLRAVTGRAGAIPFGGCNG